MKRFAIYVFYDKQGIVREYVLYCLRGLLEIIPEILVVVNGPLMEESRKKLLALGINLLERDNTGFDFWAWKTGIEWKGYETLAEYDELLLTNNSYYGPLYPFAEMWGKMDTVVCDFWGITKAPGKNALVLKENSAARYLEHVQSYWLVFRKTVLASPFFREYWEKLPQLKTFRAAIQKGEVRLTNFFEARGFLSASYMNFEKYSRLMWANPTFLHDMQVIDDHCPIVKRKAFFEYGNSALIRTNEHRLQNLFHYIQKSNIYDIDMVWEDLLATQPMSRIHEHLHLNYILSASIPLSEFSVDEKHRVLIIVFAKTPYTDEKYTAWIKAFSQFFRLILVCDNDTTMEWYTEKTRPITSHVEIRMQDTQGDWQKAAFFTCSDAVVACEYVCVMNIREPSHSIRAVEEENKQEHCFASLAPSPAYILQILSLFDKNPRLGLLVPVPLFDFWSTPLVKPWNNLEDKAKSFLMEKWGLSLDLDPFVMAPFGGMFWFRREALKTLCSVHGDSACVFTVAHKDTSSFSHIFSCLIPHLAQYNGYYTAYVLPETFAPVYLNICYTQLRNEKLDAKRFIKAATKRKWKKFLDNPYYFYHDAKKPIHYLKYLFLHWK